MVVDDELTPSEQVADDLVAADFVDHSGPGWSRTFTGRAFGKPQFYAMLHTAFPDIEVVIHDQLAEGDRVVTRKSFRGTHRGEFMGVSPTGKQVVIDVIDIHRIENGQSAEHWTVADMLSVIQQLGAVPSRAPAVPECGRLTLAALEPDLSRPSS